MKKLLSTLGIFLTLSAFPFFNSNAQSVKKEDTNYAIIENTITNKNILYGLNLGTGPMSQLSAEFGNKDFSLGTWINFSGKDKEVKEIDLLFSKTFEWGDKYHPFSLTPGIAYYTFPSGEFGDSQDLFLNATLSNRNLKYDIRIGKIFGSYNGVNIKAKISSEIKMTDKLSIEPFLVTYYNRDYFVKSAEGVSSYGGGLKATYNFDDKTRVSLEGNIQKRIDDVFEPYVNNESFWNVSVTKEF